MSKTVSEKIIFENVEPATLFAFYTDARKHAELTGAPAEISDRTGDEYQTYGDFSAGKNLFVEPDKLIVQTWRAKSWSESDADSILILRFVKNGNDTDLYLTHADIPAREADATLKAWHDFYWHKWKSALADNSKNKQ